MRLVSTFIWIRLVQVFNPTVLLSNQVIKH